MGKSYSEQEIKTFFADFQSIKKYAQKIHFFDLYFNVVPFDFQGFEVDVFKFFSAAGVQKLTEVLKLEQKKPALLNRIFYFQDASYTFSIVPNNSNAATLNSYILSKFLNKSSTMSMVARQKKLHRTPTKLWEELLVDANERITFVRKRIDAEYGSKASNETKFMAVFMKGYNDRINDLGLPAFVRRRKFLELYLYAYGYTYGEYVKSLCEPADNREKIGLDQKIELLKELGIMDAIKNKYFSLNSEELNLKATEIVSFLTGEPPKKLTEKLAPLLTAHL